MTVTHQPTVVIGSTPIANPTAGATAHNILMKVGHTAGTTRILPLHVVQTALKGAWGRNCSSISEIAPNLFMAHFQDARALQFVWARFLVGNRAEAREDDPTSTTDTAVNASSLWQGTQLPPLLSHLPSLQKNKVVTMQYGQKDGQQSGAATTQSGQVQVAGATNTSPRSSEKFHPQQVSRPSSSQAQIKSVLKESPRIQDGRRPLRLPGHAAISSPQSTIQHISQHRQT
ncbi:hypothetical protein C2845_PM05G20890 [Panicum miliaceum]|uniref:Uncharacterized protein n=1 Tax=Panicum miliaceum TaxID=4540 RepID=A0A3L6STC4_PANMI|nr:hypothetical protein C2845_PM05G20890 [Panicum miliaceum]